MRIHLRAEIAAEGVQQARVRPHLPGMDVDAERVEPVPFVVVELEHAGFVVAASGKEIPDRLGPPRHLNALGVAVPVPQRGYARVLNRRVDAQTIVAFGPVALDARAKRDHDQRALSGKNERLTGRAHSGKCVIIGIPVAVVEHPGFGIGGPVRGTRASALGRDHDDAIGGIGAVQRGRRRTLHDLDVLHVFGADVAEAAEIITAIAER